MHALAIGIAALMLFRWTEARLTWLLMSGAFIAAAVVLVLSLCAKRRRQVWRAGFVCMLFMPHETRNCQEVERLEGILSRLLETS
jgi:hypothetical protein